MQADSQTRVIDAAEQAAFFFFCHGALKPLLRLRIAPRPEQAVADLMQAASQASVIDAPVHVAFFRLRHGALKPRPRFFIAPHAG